MQEDSHSPAHPALEKEVSALLGRLRQTQEEWEIYFAEAYSEYERGSLSFVWAEGHHNIAMLFAMMNALAQHSFADAPMRERVLQMIKHTTEILKELFHFLRGTRGVALHTSVQYTLFTLGN